MKNLLLILLAGFIFTYSTCVDTEVKQCAIMTLESTPDSLIKNISVDTNIQELALVKYKLWTTDTITVGFLDGDRDIQLKTLNTAKVWEQYTRLYFKEVPVTQADIRVTFATGGSWSYIGTDCKYIKYPNATMQLGWLIRHRNNPTEINRVVIHEFGHAIGAIHEHQSPGMNIPWNVEAVYRLYAGQGWNKEMVDRNVLGKYGDSTIVSYSTGDRQSIMMYAIDRSLVLDPAYAVGWNTNLSPIDKEFISKIYPKRNVIRDSIKVDSCIVQKKVIVKDTLIKERKQIITYKDTSYTKKLTKDSLYCKDTVFYRKK